VTISALPILIAKVDRPAADSTYLSAEFLTILLAVATTARTRPGLGITGTSGRAPARLLRASTTPGQLRFLLAGLVLLCLLWGAVAAFAAGQHASGASAVVSTSEPLSLDGQRIYRSLSDADATAASAFLAGGLEPQAVRSRYLADIAEAASSLESATTAAGHSAARRDLAALSANLPVYTGEIETARADNRLGLPLGAAYLREASGLMRGTLLPAARGLYQQANVELAAQSGQATGLPFALIALLAAIAVGVVLFRSQRWLSRRTHRVANAGLLLASVAGIVSVLWLVVALTVARVELGSARAHGSAPVEALAQADIAALQAHADESLTLIDNSGADSFQADFVTVTKRIGPGPGTLLAAAASAANDSPGSADATAAQSDATAWYAAHRRLRSLDDGGAHSQAVASATGSGPRDSGALFRQLDTALDRSIAADQAVFRSHAVSGRGATTGLEAGMIVLAVIMAAGCALGLRQRLAEYQ
jgi:phosphoribosylanthranilate isomerase